jgi:hypothetical protein
VKGKKYTRNIEQQYRLSTARADGVLRLLEGLHENASLGQGRERCLIVDVESGTACCAVGTTASAAPTPTAAGWPIASVTTAATTTTALRTIKAGVDLNENLLVLLGTSLGRILGLQTHSQ